MDIVALFHCLQPSVPSTTWRHLSRMALALLVMTGRGTMLGLSRWAGTGGSARTVQRFCSTAIPWAILSWVFCRPPVSGPEEVSLAAGDAVVGTTAGKHTPGLDRCLASFYGKPGPGRACFTVSLVRVQTRRALPRRVAQVGRRDAAKAARTAPAAAQKPKAPPAKCRPGRPQGRTTTNQAPLTLPPALVRITARGEALRRLLTTVRSVPSLVLAGPGGHHNALQRARQCHWHRSAKLWGAAALSCPSPGP